MDKIDDYIKKIELSKDKKILLLKAIFIIILIYITYLLIIIKKIIYK